MSTVPNYHFISTALDAAQLSMPYRVQTNWYVLTGAASSGKSTMIEQLAGLGFQTVAESARLYI